MAIKFLSDLQTYGTINVGEEISSWNHGPSGKLQVNTPNNTTGFKIDIGGGKAVYSFSGNSTSGYLTFFKTDDVASYIGQDSAWRDLRFQTNSADRIVIKGNGNVGIGTTTPTEKLEVIGNFKAGSLKIGSSITLFNYFNNLIITAPTSQDIILGGGPGSVQNDVKVANGDLYVSGAYYDSSNSTGTSGQVLSSTVSGTDWVSLSEIQGVDGTGTANYITKWSDSDTVTDSIIYDDGTKVGIGTTSPYKTLDVQGEAVVSQNLWIGPVGGNDATNSLEIGRGRTGNGICFIDMTTDNTTYTDYGFRLIRYSGVNANTELIHRGTGDFRIKGQDASTMTFYTGNSARMRIGSTGNVGIGTTSPSAKLEVSGGVFVNYPDGSGASLKIGRSDNSNYWQVGHAGNDFRLFNTAGAGSDILLDIDNGGISQGSKVGIGTASPSKKLHIADSGDPKILIEDTSGDNQVAVIYKTTNYEWTAGLHGGEDAFKISNSDAFNTNDYFTVESSGNVGIGTTSPDAKLRVNYDENTGTAFKVTGGGSGNPIASFVRDIGTSGTINIHASNAHPQISFGNTSTTFAAGAAGTQFRISHSSDINTNTLLAVGSGGNVGIGTTSPTARLHVADAGNPTILIEDTVDSNQVRTTYKNTDFTMVTGLHGTNKTYRIMAGSDFNTVTNRIANFDGNNLRVSIGNVTPARKLHVIGDNNIVARFDTTTANTGAFISFVNTTSTNDNQVKLGADPGDGNKLSLWSSNTKTMTLSNGNVGIGTDSPSDTLEVAAASQQLRLTDTDDSKYAQFSYSGGNLTIRNNSTTTSAKQITLQEAGNVGIGTISPVGKLSVYRTDTTYAANLYDARSRSSLYLKGSGNFDSELTFSSGSSNVQFIQAVNSAATSGRDIAINPFGGGVGIGTTNPGYNLDVTGTARITNNMWLGSNIYHDNDGNSAYIGFPADDTWRVVTGGSERLRVSSNGNVGIGVTGPSYALDVDGTVDATSFRAGGISKYTTYNSTNTYENYGTTISNIASSPVGYLYHDLLAFNYNYTVTQEVSTDGTNFSSETLDKRLFSQKQDQSITVVSSSEYAVRWTIEGTAWNSAKFINLAFTYTNPHPETRVIIESSADGTTWTSRHDSTASGITGTKSCYVSSWSGNNYVRITISKTSSNTNLIKLSSIKMMTARAGDQGDGMELQYPYVWDEDRNIGLLLTKSDTPTSKLDILGATNTSNSSLLRVRTTNNPNALEKVVGFHVNTNTERGYIALNQYGVTYSTSSDYRLKENVTPLSDATERLKLLKPCRFNFIGGDPNYVVDGFLAHEAAEAVPESVSGEKDAIDENNEPVYQGIDQSKIVPLLTAALQEAIEKIEQLENRIQTLENN